MNEIERITKLVEDIDGYTPENSTRYDFLCKKYLLTVFNSRLAYAYLETQIVKDDAFLRRAVSVYSASLDNEVVTIFDDYYDALSEGTDYDAYSDAKAVFSGDIEFTSFIDKYAPYIAKVTLDKYNFS